MVQRWQLRSLHHKALGTMCHTLLKYSKDPLFQLADWGDLGAVREDLARLLRLPHPREVTNSVLEAMLLDSMRDYLHGRDPAIEPHGNHLTFKLEYRRTCVEACFEYHHRTLRFSHWRRHQRSTSDSHERAASNDVRNRNSRSSSSRDDRRSADIRSRRSDTRSSSDDRGRKRERSQSSPMRTTVQQQAPPPSAESIGSKPLTRKSPQTVSAEFPDEPQQSSSALAMAKHRLLNFVRTVAMSTSNDDTDTPQNLHDNDDGDAEESELVDLTEDFQEESPKRRRLEDAPAQDAPPAMLQTPPSEQGVGPLSARASGSTDRESNSSDDSPAESPQPTLLFRNERDGHDGAEDGRVSEELQRERHALVLRICDKLLELQAHRCDSPLVIDLTGD